MNQSEVLRRYALLAPGKRITVVTEGKSYALPLQPETVVEAAHPLQEVSAQLLARDAETREVLQGFMAHAADAVAAVKATVENISEGQSNLAQSVKELSGTLHLPVKPIYNKAGKLIGAQRVKEN